jgi:hypothetical protein
MAQRDREAELEKQANRLLRQAQAAKDEKPAYSDHYLAERDKRRAGERSLEEVFDATVGNLDPVADLFEAMWMEIRNGASRVGCTDRQIDFLEARRYEESYEVIADTYGCTRMTVMRDLKDAAKRIQHIPAWGLWSVLSEVFHVDIYRIRDILLNQ